jgi:putative Mg2+ transporter-C (MgtC) family protein
MQNYEMILRLILALFLGALLGVERVRAGKRAGLRTLGLVSMGSALFIVISENVISEYGFEIDPLRMAANIITGIGFLGAGMIFFKEDHVSNLTTAAGIWLAAAIGTAVGFGMYMEAIVATALVIVTFSLMWNVEESLRKRFKKQERLD